MSSRSQFQDHGYNQEEMYFHKKDQELIQKLKQKDRPTKTGDPSPPQKEISVIPLRSSARKNTKKAA